jgi:probable rRNA maturation factor
VITFPSHEPDDDGAAYIGDIVVSRTRAAEQGNDADHSTERELAFLALHGLLHLAGFRDDDDGEREEMLRRQEALLTAFEASENPPW